MNKNQVVLTNQIEFLLSKAHWELHKHLCGAKVKQDEEGGDRGALQRWIPIYQTRSLECMDRRLSAAPPSLLAIIPCLLPARDKRVPVFHLWNCSYHTAEELDKPLGINMLEEGRNVGPDILH